MLHRKCFVYLAVVFIVMAVCTAGLAQGVPNSITYQGKLTDSGGNPLSGDHSMQFKLWSEETGGYVLWDSGTLTVPVNAGLFTVTLGTPSNAITPYEMRTGGAWIETKVGTETLPRVKLTSTPFALRAGDLALPYCGSITNLNVAFQVINSGMGDSVWGTAYGTGTAGVFKIINPSNTKPALHASTTGTGPAAKFDGLVEASRLGTMDNEPLEFRVWQTRALRIEPGDRCPNIIGGHRDNRAEPGAYGATIGGGGLDANRNRVTNPFGTVSGGLGNTAGETSTVGGGRTNTASAPGDTVGGGISNTASGGYSTIGGGDGNIASQYASTVGGGRSNIAGNERSTVSGGWYNHAAGASATIPGGNSNYAGGDHSFAAGRRAKVRDADAGTFVWADSTDVDFQSTGQKQFLIRATGGVGINKDNPQSPLDVAGTAQMTGLKLTTGAGAGKVLVSDGAGVGTWQTAYSGDDRWGLTGNSGTSPTTNFLGTTDNQPLELRVNNIRVLRVEPGGLDDCPNIIAGSATNSVVGGAVLGATISGGGYGSNAPNKATSFGTVGGRRGEHGRWSSFHSQRRR